MGASLMKPETKTVLRADLLPPDPHGSVFNRLFSALNGCKHRRHMSNALRAFTAYLLGKLRDLPFCFQSKYAPEAGAANPRPAYCGSQRRPQVSHRIESSAGDNKLYDLLSEFFGHGRLKLGYKPLT
jgi:hypothetical protein